jgi:hypothetical protein
VTGRLGALAATVAADVQARSRRAFLLAIGAALLASFALGASIVPVAIAGNLLLSYAVFVGAFGAALAAALLAQYGGTFGDALAVAGWARLDAEERWRRLGAGRIPRSEAEARSWLDAHQDQTVLQPQRLTAQLFAGDLEAARTTLARYPSATAFQRFDALNDAWFLDFVGGELPALHGVEAAAREVEDPDERLRTEVSVAMLRAHTAVAAGGDWVPPLASLRPLLGSRAGGVVGTRYVMTAWTLLMTITTAMVGVALLVGRVTGVWR